MSKPPHPSLVRLVYWGVLAVAYGACEIACGQSAILNLRNGDRLTGTILREETNQVTFKTSWYNVVVVPAAEIKSRELIPPGPALPAGQVKPGPPPATFVAAPSVPPPNTMPAGAKPASPKVWINEAQVGLDLLYSERTRQLYSGRYKSTFSAPPFRALFDYQAAYGQTDGLMSDNRMYGSLKTDWDFKNSYYLYNLAGAGYDHIRKVDFRYEVGPGLGYHLFTLPVLVLNVEGGGNYQAEYHSDKSRIESFYLRFAEDATLKLSSKVSLDEKFEFFPKIDEWDQYRFRVESNLRFALLNNLSFILTLMDQYDTQPARNVPQNTLQVTSSIGVKF